MNYKKAKKIKETIITDEPAQAQNMVFVSTAKSHIAVIADTLYKFNNYELRIKNCQDDVISMLLKDPFIEVK